jgi:hypothetical protein
MVHCEIVVSRAERQKAGALQDTSRNARAAMNSRQRLGVRRPSVALFQDGEAVPVLIETAKK